MLRMSEGGVWRWGWGRFVWFLIHLSLSLSLYIYIYIYIHTYIHTYIHLLLLQVGQPVPVGLLLRIVEVHRGLVEADLYWTILYYTIPYYTILYCTILYYTILYYIILDYNTVSFHNFKSQNFKLSVSNPKSKYVVYLSVLSQISNCQGLGRKNKHGILTTDRNSYGGDDYYSKV